VLDCFYSATERQQQQLINFVSVLENKGEYEINLPAIEIETQRQANTNLKA